MALQALDFWKDKDPVKFAEWSSYIVEITSLLCLCDAPEEVDSVDKEPDEESAVSVISIAEDAVSIRSGLDVVCDGVDGQTFHQQADFGFIMPNWVSLLPGNQR